LIYSDFVAAICLAQEKLFLTYQTYAASQLFLRALSCLVPFSGLELEANQGFLNSIHFLEVRCFIDTRNGAVELIPALQTQSPTKIAGLHMIATWLWRNFVAACDVCRQLSAGVRIELS
jgi:hypothetical protein